jgi:hypothetical protein
MVIDMWRLSRLGPVSGRDRGSICLALSKLVTTNFHPHDQARFSQGLQSFHSVNSPQQYIQNYPQKTTYRDERSFNRTHVGAIVLFLLICLLFLVNI